VKGSVLAFTLVLAVADSTIGSTTSEASTPDATIHDPRACPALFGDDVERARIARFKARSVGEVSAQNDLVTVMHSVAAWRDVTVHRRHGLSVTSIEHVKVTAPSGAVTHELVALIDVGERALPKESTCATGLYALTPDDSIGDRGFVLHLDARGILVELDGQLGWLPVPGKSTPRTRLVWRSSVDSSVDERMVSKRAPTAPVAVRTFKRL